jgi:hypothetical protein
MKGIYQGAARLGMARLGEARPGTAWHGEAITSAPGGQQGQQFTKDWRGSAGCGLVRQCKAGFGVAMQSRAPRAVNRGNV